MRKITILFGLLLVFMPEWIVRLLYGGRLPVVDGRRIDPKAHAVSRLVQHIRGDSGMPSVEESRAQLATLATKFDLPCPADVAKTDITLPGAEGPRIVRIYASQGTDPFGAQPTLLYLHGGGWIQGSIKTHDGLCGQLAKDAGIRVISLDYRLAPEHKFPAAVNDVLAGYRALTLGTGPVALDASQLVVGGDSAGANLTAALMHDLAVSGDPMPAAQLLIYPAVDAALDTASMRDLRDQPLLPRTRIDWFMDLYIPDGQDRLDPRISPLYSNRLTGQPPALIIAGGHDALWSDGQNYAKALQATGVTVKLLEYPGQVHAFLSLRKVIPQGVDAEGKVADWLRRVLAG
ncbi:Carboxylesterase NlhH [Thalassovita gelatinovora]|uniref:Carboxylesterase NlhH n=1 Tax=Thalassovita gelatinovora TaxID=53501 RepID=A0A0P1F6C5_THAGE|nr:alpha/beta hydrolase [Thalassovita gelatinovora]QIZ80879.1 alpha/beta hydrolase [Thalassovita gelatinovora]CUH63341.1 Carboxylesterase NlhH [Thalassovita gelatinovora]SEQ65456.1 acetyl esterase [Thalassovita gelatinovora]